MPRSSALRWTVHRTLRFELVVWIGDMGDSRRRELYRRAFLSLDNVVSCARATRHQLFVVESRPYQNRCGGRSAPQSSSTLPAAPAGTQTTWMYLGELDRFLLFSAGNASLEWTGPEENRT